MSTAHGVSAVFHMIGHTIGAREVIESAETTPSYGSQGFFITAFKQKLQKSGAGHEGMSVQAHLPRSQCSIGPQLGQLVFRHFTDHYYCLRSSHCITSRTH